MIAYTPPHCKSCAGKAEMGCLGIGDSYSPGLLVFFVVSKEQEVSPCGKF